MALYDTFPYLSDELIIIKKMIDSDVEALAEITGDERIYKFIPLFLYKKSKGNLLAAGYCYDGRIYLSRQINLFPRPFLIQPTIILPIFFF